MVALKLFLNWIGDAVLAATKGALSAIEMTRRVFGASPIETVTTQAVRQMLAEDPDSIVLVDVRSDKEQQVSRIPHAISRQAYEADRATHDAKLVVPYCTAGGRSYLYAVRLQRQGMRAANYQDSVLGWVAHGFPLVTPDGEPTKRIHPYWRIFRVPAKYEITTDP